MTRQLFIVRHAQTYQSQHDNSDKDRTLKPEGILQAKQLGKFISDSNFNVNLIISSDAVRARTTAQLIAASMNYPEQFISEAEKIYSGTCEDLLDTLLKIPASIQQAMLVGHYPTVVELYNYLTGAQKTGMSTCELNVLTIKSTWSMLVRGCGSHLLHYQPQLK